MFDTGLYDGKRLYSVVIISERLNVYNVTYSTIATAQQFTDEPIPIGNARMHQVGFVKDDEKAMPVVISKTNAQGVACQILTKSAKIPPTIFNISTWFYPLRKDYAIARIYTNNI